MLRLPTYDVSSKTARDLWGLASLVSVGQAGRLDTFGRVDAAAPVRRLLEVEFPFLQ